MKKVLIALLAALAVMVSFVSCDSNSAAVAETDTAKVNLVVSAEKNLESSVNKDIKYWEFMARPDFTLAEGENVYGVVSYWKALPSIDTDAAPAGLKLETELGMYTSGSWLFEVRALNSYHQVIAIGETRQIIRKGLNNTINVVVYTDRADGTHGESMDRTSATAGSTAITAYSGEGITLSTNTNYGTGNGTYTTTQYGTLKAGMIVNRLDDTVGDIRIKVYSQKITRTGTVVASQVYDAEHDTLVTGATNGYTDVTPETWTIATEGQSIALWTDARNSSLHPNSEVRGAGTVGSAKVYYECTIPNIDAGPYIYTFVVEGKAKVAKTGEYAVGDWIVLGGQAVDTLIIGGETTYVTGTLLANDYVIAGLKITAPGSIFGTINGVNYIRGTVGTAVTLTFNTDTVTSAEAATTYYWYVNGDLLKDGNGDLITTQSISFSCPKESNIWQYGIYRISCTPTGALGSIGNATVDVIFNPADGPNVGEFDWASLGLD